ncbi:MAG: AbrB/MazE/SpoVT family DNA-binding domain-containing protein [Desulfamplus sp.]|nr:AbrB/MazE/SpoVT family DNA-binding domain-containing protein [Desulfamplus sp.]
MEAVVVSDEFQIMIPHSIRESLHIKPGQKIQIIQYENRIEFIPVRNISQMRGFLKGINTDVPRDKDRI